MKHFTFLFLLLGLFAGYLQGMESTPTDKTEFKYFKKAVKRYRAPGYHKSDRPEPVHTTCPECDKTGFTDDFDATRHLRDEHNAIYLGTQWDYNRTVWTIMYQLPRLE